MRMLITTERPKLWQTVKRAWRSTLDAAGQMIALFIIAFVLAAALNIAATRVPEIFSIPTRDALKDALTNGRRLKGIFPAIGLSVADLALRSLIFAPVAVAVHRFILLGETRRFYFLSAITLRFAAWIMALQSLALILSWLILFATGATGLVPLLYLLLFALVICYIQTLPLFPAVAVEESSANISARLETALERAENVFLLTVGTALVTLLPIILVRIIAARGFAKLAERLPLLAPLAQAAAGLITLALLAAVLSYIYSYTAHRPPAAQPARPAPSIA
jgi:hypothetical protein